MDMVVRARQVAKSGLLIARQKLYWLHQLTGIVNFWQAMDKFAFKSFLSKQSTMENEAQTNYTPPVEDNLLGLLDKELINLYEASGIAKAEILLQEMEEDVSFDTSLILKIHRIAFSELYEWAGKWRNIEVQVGKLTPPLPSSVPYLMYQYAEDVGFRLGLAKGQQETAEILAYLHHRFVWIHPFNNGNGRTARLMLNLAAMIKGFEPMQLYHRTGEARKTYIEALRAADSGNMLPLTSLIFNELTPL